MSELDLGRVVGYGLPAGGAAGQIPVKQSAADYDTEWQYPQYFRSNLLDNWYFVGGGSQKGNGVFPINQRGQTVYTGGKTIDRWADTFSTHATVTLPASGSCLSIANTSESTRTVFMQYLTLDSTVLSGKTVTASILLEDNSLISGTGVVPNPSTGSIPAYITIVGLSGNSIIRLGTNASGGCGLEIVNGQKQTLNIVAVKLELGTYQTLAHQENGVWVLNELPNFSEELAKCQRYQFKCATAGRIRACLAVANSIQFFVPTPQMLVKAPDAASLSGCYIETLIGDQQTGFTFSTFVSIGGNGFMVSAAKTAHGLSDAVLNLNGALIYT